MKSIKMLKQLMNEATNLTEPLNYFMGLIENKELFGIKGHRGVKRLGNNEELISVIAQVQQGISEWFGKPVEMLSPMFYEIPRGSFYHGVFAAEEIPVPLTVLYFSDLKKGLFAIPGMGQAQIFGFSLASKFESELVH